MRILHVFRSPVGGLFRHVRDLSRGQNDLGHQVALFCDSSTGGAGAAVALEACAAWCTGGITTLPIARLPAISDAGVIAKAARIATEGKFDVIHGHGAKGGLIARLVARKRGIPSLYTPHGGSLHYRWRSPAGAAFLGTEKLLARLGSGFVFVCSYEKQLFAEKIGLAGKPSIISHNGLWPEEFHPVNPRPGATDLVFVGEVRHLKGIDILLDAVKTLAGVTLTVVGDGPELEQYKALAATLGLSRRVTFAGRLPIREALSMGRVMVVPSRNESFPYVVLETAAAAVPMVATCVGGIPEVLPTNMLCEPDAHSLTAAIQTALAAPAAAKSRATVLAANMREAYSVTAMAQTITGFYETLLR